MRAHIAVMVYLIWIWIIGSNGCFKIHTTRKDLGFISDKLTLAGSGHVDTDQVHGCDRLDTRSAMVPLSTARDHRRRWPRAEKGLSVSVGFQTSFLWFLWDFIWLFSHPRSFEHAKIIWSINFMFGEAWTWIDFFILGLSPDMVPTSSREGLGSIQVFGEVIWDVSEDSELCKNLNLV